MSCLWVDRYSAVAVPIIQLDRGVTLHRMHSPLQGGAACSRKSRRRRKNESTDACGTCLALKSLDSSLSNLATGLLKSSRMSCAGDARRQSAVAQGDEGTATYGAQAPRAVSARFPLRRKSDGVPIKHFHDLFTIWRAPGAEYQI